MQSLKTGINIKLNKDILKKYSISRSQLENQKTIAYLYAILTFLSISLFGFFAINPALSTISNLKRVYEDSKTVDESLTKKINDLKQLDTQYRQIEPLLDNIYMAIPTSPKAAYFSRQIEIIAKENNIVLDSLEITKSEIFPAKKKDEGDFNFEADISFTGSGEDMYNFVEDLINFDRMVSINRLSITLDKEDKEKKDQYKISFKSAAYFNKE